MGVFFKNHREIVESVFEIKPCDLPFPPPSWRRGIHPCYWIPIPAHRRQVRRGDKNYLFRNPIQHKPLGNFIISLFEKGH